MTLGEYTSNKLSTSDFGSAEESTHQVGAALRALADGGKKMGSGGEIHWLIMCMCFPTKWP